MSELESSCRVALTAVRQAGVSESSAEFHPALGLWLWMGSDVAEESAGQTCVAGNGRLVYDYDRLVFEAVG